MRGLIAAALAAFAVLATAGPADAHRVSLTSLQNHITQTRAGGACGDGIGIACRAASIRSYQHYGGTVGEHTPFAGRHVRKMCVTFREWTTLGHSGQRYSTRVVQWWSHYRLLSIPLVYTGTC